MKRGHTTSFEEPTGNKVDALNGTQAVDGPVDETQAVDETQPGAVDETQGVVEGPKQITLARKEGPDEGGGKEAGGEAEPAANFQGFTLEQKQKWQEQEAKFLQGLTPDVRARFFRDRREIQAQQASHSESKKPKLDGDRASKSSWCWLHGAGWSSNVLKPELGVDGEQPLVPKQLRETRPLSPGRQVQDTNTKEQQQGSGTSQMRVVWPPTGWQEPTENPPGSP